MCSMSAAKTVESSSWLLGSGMDRGHGMHGFMGEGKSMENPPGPKSIRSDVDLARFSRLDMGYCGI